MVLAGLLLAGGQLKAQTTFSYTGGNRAWTNPAAWVKSGAATTATYPGAVAGQTHDVSIDSSTVTISAGLSSNSIRTVTVAAGASLVVNAATTFSNAAASLTGGGTVKLEATLATAGGYSPATTASTGGATLQAAGSIATSGTSGKVAVQYTGSGSNTLALSGSFASLTAVAGTLTASGSYTLTQSLSLGGTYTHAAGTITFSGNSLSGSGTITLPNLVLSASGTITNTMTATIKGDLTQSGSGALNSTTGRLTFDKGNTMNINGAGTGAVTLFNVTVGGSNNSYLTIGRNVIVAGTATGATTTTAALGVNTATNNVLNVAAGSKLSITGSGASIISNNRFDGGTSSVYEIDADNVSLKDAVTFTNFSLAAGRALTTDQSVTVRYGMSLANNAPLVQTAGTFTFSGAGQSLTDGNTAPVFNNLAFTGSGTKSVGYALAVNGSMSIGSGVTVNVSTNDITLKGDYTSAGTLLQSGASRMIFAGTGAQALSGTLGFRNVQVTNTTAAVTAANAMTVAVNTQIPASATLCLPGIAGNNLGTVSGTGTLQLTAAASANTTFPGGTYSAFLPPGTGTVEYTGNTSYNIYDVPALGYAHLKVSGTGTKTLTQAIEVQGNLTIASGATLSGGTVNMTLFKGDIQNDGTFDGGANGDVRLSNTAAVQSLKGAGTYNFQQLTLAKNGQATALQAPIRVNIQLNFETDGFLDLNAYNLTLAPTANLLTNTAFGTACMIRQTGTTAGGALVREGTSTGQFLQTLPIGSGTKYAPVQFSRLTATVSGTATISVKTVTFTTAANNVLKRYWRINQTGISAITDARFNFTYPASEVSGTPNQVVRYDNLGNPNDPTGDFFDGISKFGISSSGNTFLEQDWYFQKLDLAVTYYSFASGNYSNPRTWTTDYNGVTWSAPPDTGGPDANDRIVILSGKTVTVDVNNTSPDSVQIRAGGTITLGVTTGHNFGKVEGAGTLVLSTGTMPTATYGSFIAAGGGTIEYKDYTGNIDPAFNTFNHLTFSGTGTKTISASANRTLTLYGNFAIKNTSRLMIGSGPKAITLSIAGDFTTEAGTQVRVANFNQAHSVLIGGNMTSQGDVRFHNLTGGPTLAQYTSLTNSGYATVEFNGSVNGTVSLTGQECSFYFLRMNKASQGTTLTITPQRKTYFTLYGQNNQADAGIDVNGALCTKALRPDVGTMILMDSVRIPSLTEGGGMFRIGYAAELQIVGTVTVTTTATGVKTSEIAPYGILRVKGKLDGGTGGGVRLLAAGQFILESGTAKISQLTTYRSAGLGVPTGGFTGNGGTLTVDGSGSTDLNFARFDILWSNMFCRFNGGIYNISNPVGTASSTMKNGGFRVNANTTACTGGVFNFYLPAVADVNQNFGLNISSGLFTVNFYNLGTYTSSNFLVCAMPYNDNGNSGSVPIRGLTINGALTQNVHCVLDVGGQTFKVGSNWSIAASGGYLCGTTTSQLTQIGQGLAGQTTVITLSFLCPSLTFNTLDLNNSAGSAVINLGGNAMTVNGALHMYSGTLNHNGVNISVLGDVASQVTCNGPGRVSMLGTAAAAITANGSGLPWDYEINKTPTAGVYPIVTLSNNLTLRHKLILTAGLLEVNASYVIMNSGSQIVNGAGDSTQAAFTTHNMITTNGGKYLRRYMNTGQRTLVWPVGTGTTAANLKYRPVLGTVGAATTYGYLDFSAAASQHPNITIPPATANDALNYFWREASGNWNNPTGIQITFVYAAADIPPSGSTTGDNTYVMGRYIYGTPNYWVSNTYTTQPTDVAAKNYIGNGDYTVGNAVAFGGLIEYWARVSGSWGRPSTWRRKQNGNWLDLAPAYSATAPVAGSAVVIPDNITINIKDSVPAIAVISLNMQGANSVLDMDTTLSKYAHDFGSVVATSGKFLLSYGKKGVRIPGGNWTAVWGANNNYVIFYRKGFNYKIPKGWTNTYRYLTVRPDGGSINLPDTALTVSVGTDFSVASTAGKVYLASTVSGDVTMGGATTIGANTGVVFPATMARTWKQNGASLTLNGSISTDTLVAINVLHRFELRYGITCGTGSSFDFQPGSLNVARGYLYWNSGSNGLISGSPSIFRLNNVTMVKNNGTMGEITVSNFHLKGDASLAAANKPIVMTTGTLRLNTPQSAPVGKWMLNTGANPVADFKISNGSVLEIYQGTALCNATGTNAGVTLEGTLRLMTGTKCIIKSNATTDSYLQLSTSAGTPTLDMGGDSLVIGGQFRSMAAGTPRASSFTLSNGVMMVGLVNALVNSRSVFEMPNNSYGFLSGGKIIICRSSGFNPEVYIGATSGGYTGGLMQVGYTNTPSATIFRIMAYYMPGLYVCGSTAGAVKPVAQFTVGPVQFGGDVTTDAGTQLTVINDTYFGGSFLNSGTYNGAAYKAIFNGAGRDQTLMTTAAFATPTLQYTPSLATSQLTMTVAGNVSVTDFIINQGTVNAGTVNIVATGNVTNSGTHSSTTGVLKVTSAGNTIATFTNGLTATYGNVEIDRNAAAIGNMSLTGNLTLDKGVFDIDTSYLYLGQGSSIINGNTALAYSGTKCIRTAGRVQDGGVNKAFAAGAFNITFPIAVGASSPYSYVPTTYNATANTAPGTIGLRPVNRPHPATTDPSNKELAFYWAVSASGFAGLNVTHTYTYLQSMQNGRGNEAAYIAARYTGSWTIGIGTIATGSNVITINGTGAGASFLSGDFTAGEFTEFSNGAVYLSNGTGGGLWSTPASWMGNAVPPAGAQVRIIRRDLITVGVNNLAPSTVTIDTNATMDLVLTTGHNLGTVYGLGTLSMSSNAFPAGNFGTFSSAGGGTVEYAGAGYTMTSTRSLYNNLRIKSSGTIDMANLATTVNGILTVAQGSFRNLNSKKLIVRGNVVNNASFIAGSATTNENLELYGDFTNSGSFTAGNTVTIFRGSSTQAVGGTTAPLFSTLQINKPSGDLVLNQSITVAKQVTLTSGKLRLRRSDLQVWDTTNFKPDAITAASYVDAQSTGMVKKYLTMTSSPAAASLRIYPVGDSLNYSPLWATLSAVTIGSNGSMDVNVSIPAHPARMSASRYLQRYWRVQGTNLTSPAMSLVYVEPLSSEVVVVAGQDTRPLVASAYSNTDSRWFDAPTGSYDASNLTFTYTAATRFADYSGGTGMGDQRLLPVTIARLTAQATTPGVQVQWTTETESNSEGFAIERSTDGGKTFTRLAFVETKATGGNSQSPINYQYVDETPGSGTNVYRLQARDRDGKTSYSNSVQVFWMNKRQPRFLTLSPNPSDGHSLKASFGGWDEGPTAAMICDALGHIVWEGELEATTGQVDLASYTKLGRGVYILTLKNGKDKLQSRFVIE